MKLQHPSLLPIVVLLLTSCARQPIVLAPVRPAPSPEAAYVEYVAARIKAKLKAGSRAGRKRRNPAFLQPRTIRSTLREAISVEIIWTNPLLTAAASPADPERRRRIG